MECSHFVFSIFSSSLLFCQAARSIWVHSHRNYMSKHYAKHIEINSHFTLEIKYVARVEEIHVIAPVLLALVGSVLISKISNFFCPQQQHTVHTQQRNRIKFLYFFLLLSLLSLRAAVRGTRDLSKYKYLSMRRQRREAKEKWWKRRDDKKHTETWVWWNSLLEAPCAIHRRDEKFKICNHYWNWLICLLSFLCTAFDIETFSSFWRYIERLWFMLERSRAHMPRNLFVCEKNTLLWCPGMSPLRNIPSALVRTEWRREMKDVELKPSIGLKIWTWWTHKVNTLNNCRVWTESTNLCARGAVTLPQFALFLVRALVSLLGESSVPVTKAGN